MDSKICLASQRPRNYTHYKQLRTVLLSLRVIAAAVELITPPPASSTLLKQKI